MRVYISGPYTGNETTNVKRAMDAWNVLADLGMHPFCPHLYHFLHFTRERTYEEWMNQCLEWVKASEVIYRIGGESKGANIECSLAVDLNIPVFNSLVKLVEYVNGSRNGQ